MTGRFQRGKVAGISPFFAFQDVITSAMAVVITIVMLLALDMGDPSEAHAPAELTQQLKSLLDELRDASAALRLTEDANAAAKLNPAILKSEIEAMKQELARIRTTNESGERMLAGAQGNDGASIVWSELEKQKAAAAAAARQSLEQEKEAARSLAEMQRAEEALQAKEGQLLAERAQKNKLWLIPDRSKTTKEPILAVVSADAITVQRFDDPNPTTLRGRGLSAKFEDALKAYWVLDQYIVFYFKPSGVEHFQALTDSAKGAGFEIGYDAIGEEIEINFRSAQ